MRGIVWFRRDLRLHDQPALTAVCKECDEVIPLFVFDEPLLQSHEFGSACVNFMLGCLDVLRSSLTESGITLQWRRGEPVEAIGVDYPTPVMVVDHRQARQEYLDLGKQVKQ